ELPGILHGQDERPGIVPLGRGSLSLLDVQGGHWKGHAFFQALHRCKESCRIILSGVSAVVWLPGCLLLLSSFLSRDTRHFQVPFFRQHAEAGKKLLLPHACYNGYLLVHSRRIKNAEESAHHYIIHFFCR